MKCPYCGSEMQEGRLTGDGRSRVHWVPDGEKLTVADRLTGRGLVDAKYHLSEFVIRAQYCAGCEKMIFDTKIQK